MILVTGGTGLLGSHLLFDLMKAGKTVRAIRRKNSNLSVVSKVFSYYSNEARELFTAIEWVEADLLDLYSLEEALDGISEVYHAGAMVSFNRKDHSEMTRVNIDGTANLVNAATEAHVQKFCHVSSIATLGRTANDEITTEETYWISSRKNSVYGISKFGAEREVWRGMEEGLRAVIINPSVILGPGFWQTNSGLFRLVYNGLKFYPGGINGFVDVRDVAAAMIRLMDGNSFGERFICSAANLSYRQLFTLMAQGFGKPAPGIPVSPIVAEIGWRAEAVRSFITGKNPVITRELAATACQEYRYSSEKLVSHTGFTFRNPENTIRDICRIYLSGI